MYSLFCFDPEILMSNEKTDENHAWFWYVVQSTCDFHLCFHWVSELMHVTNLAIFYSLSNLWIINEFENYFFPRAVFLAATWLPKRLEEAVGNQDINKMMCT